MLNIVLFGGPGAGKGTQAERLSKKYDLVHLSTGDMLRSEIARGTERGQQAKQLIEKGGFVPDHVVVEMVDEQIRQHKAAKGLIFDGFPRTIVQAGVLDRMLAEINLKIHAVLALDAPENVLVQRLLNRGKVSGRADDQDESVIRNRIVVYNEQTAPLIDFYKAQGKYVPIDGAGEIEAIFDKFCEIVEELQRRAII